MDALHPQMLRLGAKPVLLSNVIAHETQGDGDGAPEADKEAETTANDIVLPMARTVGKAAHHLVPLVSL